MEQPKEQSERFEPSAPTVRRERGIIAVVSAILGPGLLYLSGERNMVVLTMLGCLAGVAAYGIYALRAHLHAVQWLQITPSGVTFARRGKEIHLTWDAIVNVIPHSHYGSFLAIHTGGARRPYTLLLEGFTAEQMSRIEALIQQHRP